MYRSVKGKIVSCLGVLGKRRRGVSNNLNSPTVCFSVGGNLWTQQCTTTTNNKHKAKKFRGSFARRNTIPFHHLSAKGKSWTAKRFMSAGFSRAEKILKRQWNGLLLGRLTTKMRGEKA